MAKIEVVDCVDPNIGGIGHLLTATAPIVAMPHGMAQAAPLTTPGMTDRYLADSIHGFPVGLASLMPIAGRLAEGNVQLSSAYDHDLETATPYYYKVLLEDEDIWAEYTVTAHSLYYRFTFPAGVAAAIFVGLPDAAALERCGDSELAGTAYDGGVPYAFFLAFSAPIESCDAAGSARTGYWIRFSASAPRAIEIKAGLSHIDSRQARRHIESEIGGNDFERIRSDARAAWNDALGRIEVEGGTEAQRTVFYTALYRSLLNMRNVTEEGRYFGFDGRVHDAGSHDFYTMDNSWDSYRCLHPLQLLLEPERQAAMVRSYLRMYEQTGWLAQFPGIGGDRPYMTGNHAAAWIWDTYAKGVRDFDAELAYAAMRRNALEATMLPWTQNGPLTELDRFYAEQGFFPALGPGEKEGVREVDGFERRQAVSLTLDHAYDDWCVAQMAYALGRVDDYALFMRRAKNYRNVYDARIDFMAPRTADGRWVEGFDPKLGGGLGGRDYFSECNSWIYTFHVQHDLEGLTALFGGHSQLERKLDALFAESCGDSKYAFLGQFPDATGLIGQFCMGNEPAFHIPYLYNYANSPWKTQRRLREIMKIWFTDGPFGICGDEDAGAMSSWFVFTAMGFYPVCPGKPVYDIGSPIFEEIRIRGSGGNAFTIRANGTSAANKYIQRATLNGQPHGRSQLEHAAVANGGILELEMGPRPNRAWGVL